MEDNKYYTPELGEISSDFEFEVHNSKDRFFFEGAEGWYKTKMDYGVLGNLANLHRLILDKQIRVKFLDKEDIEAEGFEVIEKPSNYLVKSSHLWVLKKKNITLTFWEDCCIVHIEINHEYLFKGTIKNRSELKKILKMIGV